MGHRLLVLAILVGAIGCGSKESDADGPAPPGTIGSTDSAGASQPELVGTYWRINRLDTMTVPVMTDSGSRAPHLQLADDAGRIRYSATIGCNGIGGEATVNGDSLTFGPGIGTKMYCEALNALEVQLHSVLTRTRRWSISGNVLELRDEAGARIAQLEKATPSP